MQQGSDNFPWCSQKSNLNQKTSIRVIQKIIKGWSKRICQERTWNFEQWKVLFKHYKPIGVFVYQITEINCRLRYFVKFVQTQKEYPISLNKISSLIEKLLVISSRNFSRKLNSSRTYFFHDVSWLSLRLFKKKAENNWMTQRAKTNHEWIQEFVHCKFTYTLFTKSKLMFGRTWGNFFVYVVFLFFVLFFLVFYHFCGIVQLVCEIQH